MKKNSILTTKNICITGLFMALTFVVTRFIQIPIPLGYFNVGNSVILLGCVLVPCPLGIIFGSLGSALADLTSYPVYTVPTLVIKLLMPLVFYMIARIDLKKGISEIIGAAVSTIIPLVGYTLVGAYLYGGLAAGLAQVPGLALEYVANLVIFCVLLPVFKKLKKYL